MNLVAAVLITVMWGACWLPVVLIGIDGWRHRELAPIIYSVAMGILLCIFLACVVVAANGG